MTPTPLSPPISDHPVQHPRARGQRRWPKRVSIAAALIVALTTTAPALANTPPPTKVQAQVSGWTGMSVKPRNIEFGQGGKPFLTNLRWSWWHNGSNAWASGKLWTVKPNCFPQSNCPYNSWRATVYLYTVKVHGSLHYFYNMAVRFYRNGAWHRQVGAFKPRPGATAPAWIFPNVWPYL